jgi:ABC-2 type transporter
MRSLARVFIMAEMHARDLLRRRIAIGLLVLLPLSYYLASYRSEAGGEVAGGVGIAFSVAGASLFSLLSSRDVDKRLVLAGYRPVELLLGRLLFLGPFGLLLSTAFSMLMVWMSDPARPWLLVLATGVVAVEAVALGLAIGSIVPRELEGTLVLIGIVGLQLATQSEDIASKALPLHAARQLVESSTRLSGALLGPLIIAALYTLVLMLLARLFVKDRMTVRRTTQHHR